MTSTVESMIDINVVNRFHQLMKRERLAHAYLLIGSEGSGKVETALAIAKMVNCDAPDESFCGECPSCLKIKTGNHPDILMCEQGEDQSIKIHKVRELIRRMQLRPYEAIKKVVIIRDMDLMTIEGANALLKTLEEPTASSLMLLTTANPERILETVKSRCHAVHFFGFSREELSRRLKDQTSLSLEDAEVLAGFSEGCLGKALRLHDEKFVVRKNELINKFLFDGVDDAMLKSISSDQKKTKEILDVLLFCFKDMMLLKAGVSGGRLTNRDRIKDLTACAARYSLEKLRDALIEIVNTKKLLDANLNVKVPLMLLKEKVWIGN